jgi:hypothetical protein
MVSNLVFFDGYEFLPELGPAITMTSRADNWAAPKDWSLLVVTYLSDKKIRSGNTIVG